MPQLPYRRWSVVVWLALVGPAPAADPEPLAQPRPVAQPVPVVVNPAPAFVPGMPPPLTGYYRTSRYDIWQVQAIDRFGRWSPRVVYSSTGSFYMLDGQPYNYLTVRPGSMQGNVLGQ